MNLGSCKIVLDIVLIINQSLRLSRFRCVLLWHKNLVRVNTDKDQGEFLDAKDQTIGLPL